MESACIQRVQPGGEPGEYDSARGPTRRCTSGRRAPHHATPCPVCRPPYPGEPRLVARSHRRPVVYSVVRAPRSRLQPRRRLPACRRPPLFAGRCGPAAELWVRSPTSSSASGSRSRSCCGRSAGWPGGCPAPVSRRPRPARRRRAAGCRLSAAGSPLVCGVRRPGRREWGAVSVPGWGRRSRPAGRRRSGRASPAGRRRPRVPLGAAARGPVALPGARRARPDRRRGPGGPSRHRPGAGCSGCWSGAVCGGVARVARCAARVLAALLAGARGRWAVRRPRPRHEPFRSAVAAPPAVPAGACCRLAGWWWGTVPLLVGVGRALGVVGGRRVGVRWLASSSRGPVGPSACGPGRRRRSSPAALRPAGGVRGAGLGVCGAGLGGGGRVPSSVPSSGRLRCRARSGRRRIAVCAGSGRWRRARGAGLCRWVPVRVRAAAGSPAARPVRRLAAGAVCGSWPAAAGPPARRRAGRPPPSLVSGRAVGRRRRLWREARREGRAVPGVRPRARALASFGVGAHPGCGLCWFGRRLRAGGDLACAVRPVRVRATADSPAGPARRLVAGGRGRGRAAVRGSQTMGGPGLLARHEPARFGASGASGGAGSVGEEARGPGAGSCRPQARVLMVFGARQPVVAAAGVPGLGSVVRAR